MDSKPDATPRLQFESAIESTDSADPAAERRALAAVICGACQSAIPDAYFDVNGTTVCESCQAEIARQAETPRGMGTLALATVFGIGAAVAGAALYYAVIAITNFEIGLVAIAIGYMVGYAVRKGAGGGGRRFQIVAIVLTYWAVGLAYVPLAFTDSSTSRRPQAQTEQAGAAVAEPANADPDHWPRPADRIRVRSRHAPRVHVRASGDGHRRIDAERSDQRGDHRLRHASGVADDRRASAPDHGAVPDLPVPHRPPDRIVVDLSSDPRRRCRGARPSCRRTRSPALPAVRWCIGSG